MPYRDDPCVLEAKLSHLLDARRELDDDIAQLRRALEPRVARERRARMRALVKGIALVAVLLCLAFTWRLLSCEGCRGGSRIDRSRSDASWIRSAAQMYLVEEPGGPCPDVGMLVRGQYLSASRDVEVDVWGTPFLVVCEEESVEVVSAGPDRIFDTEDDVR